MRFSNNYRYAFYLLALLCTFSALSSAISSEESVSLTSQSKAIPDQAETQFLQSNSQTSRSRSRFRSRRARYTGGTTGLSEPEKRLVIAEFVDVPFYAAFFMGVLTQAHTGAGVYFVSSLLFLLFAALTHTMDVFNTMNRAIMDSISCVLLILFAIIYISLIRRTKTPPKPAPKGENNAVDQPAFQNTQKNQGDETMALDGNKDDENSYIRDVEGNEKLNADEDDNLVIRNENPVTTEVTEKSFFTKVLDVFDNWKWSLLIWFLLFMILHFSCDFLSYILEYRENKTNGYFGYCVVAILVASTIVFVSAHLFKVLCESVSAKTTKRIKYVICGGLIILGIVPLIVDFAKKK